MKKQINNSIQRKELLTVVSKYIGVLIFPIAEYKLNVAKKFYRCIDFSYQLGECRVSDINTWCCEISDFANFTNGF